MQYHRADAVHLALMGMLLRCPELPRPRWSILRACWWEKLELKWPWLSSLTFLTYVTFAFLSERGWGVSEWWGVSSAPCTAYFILSSQSNLSYIFGRMSCLFSVWCAYLVLHLAIFVTWMPPISNYILLSLLLWGWYCSHMYVKLYLTKLSEWYKILNILLSVTLFQYASSWVQGKLILILSWLLHLHFLHVTGLCFGCK